MITITLDFVGLFLFDNRLERRKRAAVIHADREVTHPGQELPLKRHQAFFNVAGKPSFENWPKNEDKYELTGGISFAAVGAGAVDTKKWALQKFEADCIDFRMDPGYFDRPRANQTHAVIELLGGTFCSWRFPIENGAINTRVTFEVESFRMFGDGERPIELDANGGIWFQNTELVPNDDFSDWLVLRRHGKPLFRDAGRHGNHRDLPAAGPRGLHPRLLELAMAVNHRSAAVPADRAMKGEPWVTRGTVYVPAIFVSRSMIGSSQGSGGFPHTARESTIIFRFFFVVSAIIGAGAVVSILPRACFPSASSSACAASSSSVA